MIKLFRKIRQNLIMENKTANYLKYAIGEIILVVIGILIALQINNWNTNRINTIEEGKIIRNLNSEFKLNKTNLNLDISRTEQSIEMGKQIMGMIDADETVLYSINIDSILYAVFEFGGLKSI
jgi:hypothetical protein